jgi:hypothetical protein
VVDSIRFRPLAQVAGAKADEDDELILDALGNAIDASTLDSPATPNLTSNNTSSSSSTSTSASTSASHPDTLSASSLLAGIASGVVYAAWSDQTTSALGPILEQTAQLYAFSAPMHWNPFSASMASIECIPATSATASVSAHAIITFAPSDDVNSQSQSICSLLPPATLRNAVPVPVCVEVVRKRWVEKPGGAYGWTIDRVCVELLQPGAVLRLHCVDWYAAINAYLSFLQQRKMAPNAGVSASSPREPKVQLLYRLQVAGAAWSTPVPFIENVRLTS